MQECQILIEYAMMNAIAMQKILKKYDKVSDCTAFFLSRSYMCTLFKQGHLYVGSLLRDWKEL